MPKPTPQARPIQPYLYIQCPNRHAKLSSPKPSPPTNAPNSSSLNRQLTYRRQPHSHHPITPISSPPHHHLTTSHPRIIHAPSSPHLLLPVARPSTPELSIPSLHTANPNPHPNPSHKKQPPRSTFKRAARRLHKFMSHRVDYAKDFM